MPADPPDGGAPLDAGPGAPSGHVSLHALIVRGEDAHFEDVQTYEWVDSRHVLEAPEPCRLVWVSASHARDGSRAFLGAVACDVWLDGTTRRAFRPPESGRQAEAAMRGAVVLESLSEQEREALHAALLMRDPGAWDLAASAVRAALIHP